MPLNHPKLTRTVRLICPFTISNIYFSHGFLDFHSDPTDMIHNLRAVAVATVAVAVAIVVAVVVGVVVGVVVELGIGIVLL